MSLEPVIGKAVRSALAVSMIAVGAQAGEIAFKPVPYPTTEAEARSVLSSDQVWVNGRWRPSGFNVLLRSGDELPLLGGAPGETIRFGTLVKEDGTPLVDEKTGQPAISNSNDFNSFIPVGDELYLVSHFETRPAAMYLTQLAQSVRGTLVPLATRPIDFSKVGGGWVHCAGSVSPWGTHLGSEEYEPEARQWVDAGLPISPYNAAMHGYFDDTDWRFNHNDPVGDPAQAKALVNPYRYGWPVEVEVKKKGKTKVTKHYAMGRTANEISYVMPDNKTVYITDDGTNTMILMFIADREGDLESGRLYAARWNQIEDNPRGGRAELDWVPLGWADSTLVKKAIKNTTLDDLFVYTNDEPAACTLKTINAGHEAPYYECLDLKNGVDPMVASRLETRRFAALRGATTEFRKVEGFTYDPEHRTAYVAISEINSGMLKAAEAATQHKGGNDHIQLTRENCGAVYSMKVLPFGRDTRGQVIPSRYVARTMEGLVAGKTVTGDPKNTCDIHGLANPDNITYLPSKHSLVIGEDTGSGHRNDLVWEFDTQTEKLTLIQTTPYGSETTSVYWYPDLGGFGYLMSVIQHPYGESDQGLSTGADDEYGYVGYFKFPKLDR